MGMSNLPFSPSLPLPSQCVCVCVAHFIFCLFFDTAVQSIIHAYISGPYTRTTQLNDDIFTSIHASADDTLAIHTLPT